MSFLSSRLAFLPGYAAIVAAIFVLVSCSEAPEVGSAAVVFPEKPETANLFYNDSDIEGLRRIANMSIGRAREVTGIEFAMVLLETLPEGFTIERYAVELMDKWRVGGGHEGKGVLFLFVEDAGEMKIEVSYELEPVFTDAFCKSFQETIKNYFASKHFGDVVTNSINNMVLHYLGKPVEAIDHMVLTKPPAGESERFLSGGGGIVERNYIYDKDSKLNSIRSVPPEVLSRYVASDSLPESVDRFLDSLEAGISHPDLDVLTPGSRYMRIEYPKTADFQKREYRDYADAMPYRILQKGNLAAVRFSENRAVPLLVVQCPDGKWRVDMPKSWGLAQGSSDFSNFVVNPTVDKHPWEFAFPDLLTNKGRFDVDFYVPIGEDPGGKIELLEERIAEEPDNAVHRLDLAKVLFWECYLILAAIDASEEATELDPDYSEAYWFAINARYRAPALEGIQDHYLELIRLHPGDSSIKKSYDWFIETTEE